VKILVDTSIWSDHLRHANVQLQRLLQERVVVTHEVVYGELACGSIRRRRPFLDELAQLPLLGVARFEECKQLVEAHRLWGKGLGWNDVHLLASCLAEGARLWTRDAALMAVTRALAVHPRELGLDE